MRSGRSCRMTTRSLSWVSVSQGRPRWVGAKVGVGVLGEGAEEGVLD